MADARQLLHTDPRSFTVDAGALAACIEACFVCAQAGTGCADACLGEENLAALVRCIRLDLECAEVWVATGKVLSRQTEYDANVTKAAGTSASTTPGCTSTVGCAPRLPALREACTDLLAAMK
jgi:hypothetical protein